MFFFLILHISCNEGARSKVITRTAYWKTFDVARECKVSTYMKEMMSEYSVDWIQYGYYEFADYEYIKPDQRIIVLKKVGCNQEML